MRRRQTTFSGRRMGRTGPHGPGVDGSVAVELGLSAPMLVILAVGIVDLGNWFNFNQALEAATRIGAEYAERGFQLPTDGAGAGLRRCPPIAQRLFRTRSPARWHSSLPSTCQLFPWTSTAGARVVQILTYKPCLGTPATRTRPLLAPPVPTGFLSRSALLNHLVR